MGQEKKEKKEEKELRTPAGRLFDVILNGCEAEDLACINLAIDATDVLRILAQVLAPSSLELLSWQRRPRRALNVCMSEAQLGGGGGEVPKGAACEVPELDERVSVLEPLASGGF